jgi:hypothetical protein
MDYKTQKKMSVREPFPPFLYCGRTLIRRKGDASGQEQGVQPFIPKFSLAFFFFGNGDSSGIAHRLLHRYQHAIAINIHERSVGVGVGVRGNVGVGVGVEVDVCV